MSNTTGRVWEFGVTASDYNKNVSIDDESITRSYLIRIRSDTWVPLHRLIEHKIDKFRREHGKDPDRILIGCQDYEKLVGEVCHVLNKATMPTKVGIAAMKLTICLVPGLKIVQVAGSTDEEFRRFKWKSFEKERTGEELEADDEEELIEVCEGE